MQVTKIDIIRTKMDVRDDLSTVTFHNVKRLGNQSHMMVQGEDPGIGTFVDDVLTYTIHKVKKPYNNIPENLLVRINDLDNGIFQDLIEIHQDTINTLLYKKAQEVWRQVEEKLELEIGRAETRTKAEIKSLPWYKRLFNNF